MPTSHRVRIVVFTLLCFTALANAQERAPNGRAKNPGLPGWCETPAADRKAELGCYTTAITELGAMTGPPVYWHLDTFPDRAAAEANRGPRSTVVDGHGRHWLFTIAEQTWRPRAGERPMAISSYGPDLRRAVFLVLHRSSEPYVLPVDSKPDAPHGHWHPKGLCPK